MSDASGDVINLMSDQYCTHCYEVVPIGETKEHREENHPGRPEIEIVPIHKEGDDLIAQSRSMGHFSPHHWLDVDGHDMCGECGAVKVEEGDIPEQLLDERGEPA